MVPDDQADSAPSTLQDRIKARKWNELFDEMTKTLKVIKDSMPTLEDKLQKIGAPNIKK